VISIIQSCGPAPYQFTRYYNQFVITFRDRYTLSIAIFNLMIQLSGYHTVRQHPNRSIDTISETTRTTNWFTPPS